MLVLGGKVLIFLAYRQRGVIFVGLTNSMYVAAVWACR